MITYIEHRQINKKKWDACIDASPNACIFVYAWYLDVVCSNWSALVLNDYEVVFPLASKSKYKINYVYQPFFTRYFGIYTKTIPSENLLNRFLSAIPEKYKYIEFCLHESNHLEQNEFTFRERKYQQLRLNSVYVNLQKNYSENAKRNIKKAIKSGFICQSNIDPETVVGLFQSTKGQELETFKSADYKTLIQLMNECKKQNKSESLAVFDKENNLCAAAFFMISNDRFIFLKSGVTDYGKSNGAMHLLFDTFIRQHAEYENTLDFGGSSVESVARFYKNFGAKDCVYLQVKKNALSRIAKWISRKS